MNSSILAIIPARGGSKVIPGKNIQPVNGKPLIAYTIEATLESGAVDGVYVSTDSEVIMKTAETYGAKVIERPEEISRDAATVESALLHAVGYLEKENGWTPEHVMTLQATSPLRSANTIKSFVKKYLSITDRFDAMHTLTETRSDFWIRSEEGEFSRLFPSAKRRRQEREPLYIENSAIYISKTKELRETNFILTKRCQGYVISEFEAVDINELIDLKWAEYLIKNKALFENS